MKQLIPTVLATALLLPSLAFANQTSTTTVTTIVKPTVVTTTTVGQTTVQVTKLGRGGKPITTTIAGKPTTTTTIVGKPTVTTTTVTKPGTISTKPPVTTVIKPTNPSTVVVKPSTGISTKDTVTGVAYVDATNKYTNVNGVEYGPSLATVRGKHELSVAHGNMNKLVVGNTTIDLLPNKANKNGIVTHTQGNVTMNVGHSLKYAKHGNYMSANLNGESASVIFYQGYETPKDKMPVSGTAVYRGVAVHSMIDPANPKNSNAHIEGRSEFKADFGAKRITGTITANDRKYGKLDLAGSIDGNNIVGDSVNGYQSMEGRFFGPNADEVSGRYDVVEPGKRYINGTFGAKK